MKKTILLILVVSSILMTGCWDKIEIEDRSFVLVIGVDKVLSQNKEDEKKFLLSFVHPDTAKEEEGKILEYLTFDVEADTFSSGINEVLQRFPKSHSYEHTTAIVFGKALVEDPEAFKYILGVFSRNHEFHTSMLMYMTDGKAQDIFEVKPKMKTLLAYYITGIAANEKFAARIERLTFLDLMKKLYDNDGDAVIPVLNSKEDELYSSYLDVIKDYRLVGQLERKETVALKWLNNKAKGGVIQLNKNKGNLPFLYHSFKRTIHLD